MIQAMKIEHAPKPAPREGQQELRSGEGFDPALATMVAQLLGNFQLPTMPSPTASAPPPPPRETRDPSVASAGGTSAPVPTEKPELPARQVMDRESPQNLEKPPADPERPLPPGETERNPAPLAPQPGERAPKEVQAPVAQFPNVQALEEKPAGSVPIPAEGTPQPAAGESLGDVDPPTQGPTTDPQKTVSSPEPLLRHEVVDLRPGIEPKVAPTLEQKVQKTAPATQVEAPLAADPVPAAPPALEARTADTSTGKGNPGTQADPAAHLQPIPLQAEAIEQSGPVVPGHAGRDVMPSHPSGLEKSTAVEPPVAAAKSTEMVPAGAVPPVATPDGAEKFIAPARVAGVAETLIPARAEAKVIGTNVPIQAVGSTKAAGAPVWKASVTLSKPHPVLPQVEGTIRWILRSKAQGAELQLHPENLGKVQIKLTVEGQQVHAQVWASEASTLPILQEHLAFLDVSLREQGLALGQFELRQGDRGQSAHQGSESRSFHPERVAEAGLQDLPMAASAPLLGAYRIELFA